jgi:hypothetical protein
MDNKLNRNDERRNDAAGAGDELDIDMEAGGRRLNDRTPAAQGDAFESLRTSVRDVLDSVVREYEPQIAEFTSNAAHQAVQRGAEFAQTAAQRVRTQSWLRIGVAAVLGIGALAVLTYEGEQSAIAMEPEHKRARRTTH